MPIIAEYDYIIVGSSLGAHYLATQLTRMGKYRVCLLEPAPFGSVPTLWRGSSIRRHPGYRTVRQPALRGRRLPWPVDPLFDQSDRLPGPGLDSLSIDRSFCEAFIEAAEHHGFSRPQAGAGLPAFAPDVRAIRDLSYLPARPGESSAEAPFTIERNVRITRLLAAGKRINGIEIQTDSVRQRRYAEAEVILAAGSIKTPHLLLLSGIGPGDEIRSFGLPVVHDLPGVGQNLQTAVGITLTGTYAPSPQMRAAGRGFPLSVLLVNRKANGQPNVQLRMLPVAWPGRHRAWHRRWKAGYTLQLQALAPMSRGRVGLHSSDPFSPPLIDPRYFADARDIDDLVTAVTASQSMLARKFFDNWQLRAIKPTKNLSTAIAIRQYLYANGESFGWAVGTCQTGEDSNSVVDTGLRPHGLTGIRIADSSVLSELGESRPAAAGQAVAQFAVESILGSAARTPAETG